MKIYKGVIYIRGFCRARIVTKNIEHLLSLDDNYIVVNNFEALDLFDGIIIPHYEVQEYNPKLIEEIYNKLLKNKNTMFIN